MRPAQAAIMGRAGMSVRRSSGHGEADFEPGLGPCGPRRSGCEVEGAGRRAVPARRDQRIDGRATLRVDATIGGLTPALREDRTRRSSYSVREGTRRCALRKEADAAVLSPRVSRREQWDPHRSAHSLPDSDSIAAG